MQRKYLLVPLAVGLVSACAQTVSMGSSTVKPQAAPDAATALLDAGRALYARQEYALAIEKFTASVRAAPDRSDGYNALAACYDMIGRFDLSKIYYERALARAPSDARVYRNMARSLQMQGRDGEALAVLEELDALAKEQVAVAAVAPPVQTAVLDAPLPPAPPAPVAEAMAEVPAAPVTPATTTAPPAPAPAPLAVETRSVVVAPPVREVAQSRTSLTIAIPPATAAPAAPVRAAAPRTAAETRAMAAIGIMNGAGKRGLARGVQTWLAKSGWQSRIGDLDRRSNRSYIVYRAAARADAHRLARQLPFPTTKYVSEQANRIVLILGRNATSVDLRRIPAKPIA